MQRTIEMILSENSAHPQRLFVFPSEIAASRWVDRILQDSHCGTLAMEQFITWDTFKQEALRSQQQDKEPIPPVLRKIFVRNLIAENAAQVTSGGVPWFSSLVPREYAHTAAFLAPWLTAMLPELGGWFAEKTGTPLGHGTKPLAEGWDSIDDDLYALTLRYRQFLNDHRCFEPAWETPPFDTKGNQCFIFFPEILADFKYYQALLENTEQVTLVGIPDAVPEHQKPQTFFYTNSRNEITEAALFIRALVEHEGVPWESIAVSVPDMEHYEPYLLREFTNRNIPVVSCMKKPVVSYPGGQLFSAIEACVSRGFSFDALANLLLNSHLPWKDPEAIAQLMDFGIKNNCICSWEEGPATVIDVWEDAFAPFSASREERAYLWYAGLKRAILALYKAPSFGELLRQYYSFREHFLDMEQGLPETNALLARCVAELLSMAALEKAFPDVSVAHPFVFFVEHLKETWYLAGERNSGLRVFPYQKAAAAPFDWHIVIGATQKDLSILFSRFGFLPAGKRVQLGITDQDASGAFIHLYTLHGLKGTAFFCAQHTFSGYALPHSSLKAPKEPKIGYGASFTGKFVGDLFREEQDFYHAQQCSPDKAPFSQYLHTVQKVGFDAWYARRSPLRKPESPETMQRPTLQGLIQERYCQSLDSSKILRVSASALESYYRCALYWLFERVLDLAQVRMETTLMAENMLGTVYHQVLDGFFKRVKTKGGVLAPLVQGKLPEAYQRLLAQSLSEVFGFSQKADRLSGVAMSALTCRLLQAQQRVVQEQIACFLTGFLRYFTGFRVLGSEKRLNYRPGGDPYLLTGTIDCILEDLRDHGVSSEDAVDTGVIVDFKLHTLPPRSLCIGKGAQGLENFQLPLYLTLAEKNGTPPIHRALFFSMVPPKPQVIFGVIQDQTVPEGKKIPSRQRDRIERTDVPEDTFHQILYEFDCKVRQYAAEVLSGNFSTYSTNEKKCFSCPWHTLCRTGYAVAGTKCPIIPGAPQDQGE